MKLRGNKSLRWVDNCFGRLLIFLLCAFRKRRAFPESKEAIGLLKLSGIGDLILLSGIIKDLHTSYPDAKIILFCGKENQEIATFIPFVDLIVPLSVTHFFASVRLLRNYRLSILFDFGQWSKIEALLSYFSKASYLVGFQTPKQNRHLLYDHVCSHSSEVHEIENFRSLVQCLKLSFRSMPTLLLKENMQTFSHPEKFCIFHPWPSGYKKHLKEWPSSHWIKLGEILLARGYEILISGSKEDAQESEKLAIEINAIFKTSGCKSIAGQVSLNQLGHLIQKATLTISVNTGIMHFAACFDRPIVALHGPTSIKRWGPLGDHAIAISSDNPCCGYLHLGFEYPKNPPACMLDISPERIVQELEVKQMI